MAVAVTSLPARAQSWTGSDGTAGFMARGEYTGLFLRCEPPGGVRMIFSGFPGGLQAGGRYTVGVSVDGTAFLLDATAEDGRSAGASVLVHAGSMESLSELIDALRKGRVVEISGPAGRYTVPLTGSGKALDGLGRSCG